MVKCKPTNTSSTVVAEVLDKQLHSPQITHINSSAHRQHLPSVSNTTPYARRHFLSRHIPHHQSERKHLVRSEEHQTDSLLFAIRDLAWNIYFNYRILFWEDSWLIQTQSKKIRTKQRESLKRDHQYNCVMESFQCSNKFKNSTSAGRIHLIPFRRNDVINCKKL
jgi:hypothetical protein